MDFKKFKKQDSSGKETENKSSDLQTQPGAIKPAAISLQVTPQTQRNIFVVPNLLQFSFY